MRSGATLVASLGTFFTIYLEAAINIVCPTMAAGTAISSSPIANWSFPPGGPSDLWCGVAVVPRALPLPMASSSCTALRMGTYHVDADEPAQRGTTTGRTSTAPSSPSTPRPLVWSLACRLLARPPCAVRGSLHTRSFNKDFDCVTAQAWDSSPVRVAVRRMRKARSEESGSRKEL